jgi:hypothetical protein
MAESNESLPSAPAAHSLATRARSIILQPRSEWPVIERENTSVRELYIGYIAPLAAIPPLAALFGRTVFGVPIGFAGSYRVPIASALASAVVQYVLSLVGVYVLAMIVDMLAPTFGGQKNSIQALKVTAYASTASWLAGAFGIIPMLGLLSILGLYSLYLIYLGLPIMMKVPRERAVAYTAAVILSAIVLFVATGLIASRFVGYPSLLSPVR